MTIKERIDKIVNTQDLSLKYQPTTVRIELTGKCTLNCNFCYHHTLKEKNIRQKFLSEEDFEKILSFLKEIKSIKEVGLFYMGESGLHPQLSNFYKKLKSLNYFTYLTTNGTIYKTIYDSINYIDSLKLSWNYKNKEDFIIKTGSNEKIYNEIISNSYKFYDKCHSLNKKFYCSTILDGNKSDYTDALSKIKFDEHYWLPMNSHAGLINSGNDGVQGQIDNLSSPIPCWCLFKGIYIDVDLNVRMCTYGHLDCHKIFNLNNSNILFNDKLLNLRKMHLENKIPNECKDCLGHYL